MSQLGLEVMEEQGGCPGGGRLEQSPDGFSRLRRGRDKQQWFGGGRSPLGGLWPGWGF